MTALPEIRRCLECDGPLPASARPTRRFCSSSCRYKHGDGANQPPKDIGRERSDRLHSRTNPKHYHRLNGVSFLVGHRDNVPWFGGSCPAECPGLLPGETYRPMEEYWRS